MVDPNFRDHRIYLIHLFRVLHKRGRELPADIYDEVADLAGVTSEQREVAGKETELGTRFTGIGFNLRASHSWTLAC